MTGEGQMLLGCVTIIHKMMFFHLMQACTSAANEMKNMSVEKTQNKFLEIRFHFLVHS